MPASARPPIMMAMADCPEQEIVAAVVVHGPDTTESVTVDVYEPV